MNANRKNRVRAALWLITLCTLAVSSVMAQKPNRPAPDPSQDVLTYHMDNYRTGWFPGETQLTVANVTPTTFGLLQTVTLDARADAEPLVVTGQTIDGQGVHDVVYVATEANSVYAIDAGNGAILWHRQYGAPVPYQYKSEDDNVYPFMGILSTPVIDRDAGAIYFVADSLSGAQEAFRLHAVSLSNGLDILPPANIQYSQPLWDGTMWNFKSKYQLQRPALLKVGGSIYIAFGSNGDINPDQARGTIMRYDAATLLPIAGQMTNTLRLPTNPYYLSSIWQCGYGLATDATGDIYFSTGNSDPRRPSYYQSFNRPHSMIRLSGDLLSLKDSFTTYNYSYLDRADADMGSGGLMVLPDQPGSIPHLAVAGGKDGRAFLLNRDHMGGYTPGGPDHVLQIVDMGRCWCGPAYYVGSDGTPRVLTGGGKGVISWQLQTSPSLQLVQEGSTGSASVSGLPDNGGVIPVVSSNGTTAGTAIIWFVQKPATSSDRGPGTGVTLKAYSATDLSQPLVTIGAGTWRHAVNSNANLIPTVALGKVYVASNQQLNIFGLLGGQGAGKANLLPALAVSTPDIVTCPALVAPLAAVGGGTAAVHDFYGTICKVTANQLTLALRSGRAISIDVTTAAPLSVLPTLGRPVHVRAKVGKDGVAHAQRISRSHVMSPLTPPDR